MKYAIYNVFVIDQVRGIFWRISGHPKFAYKSNLTHPNLTLPITPILTLSAPRSLPPPFFKSRFKGTFWSWIWCTRNVIKITILTRICPNLYPKKVLYKKYKNRFHQHTIEAKPWCVRVYIQIYTHTHIRFSVVVLVGESFWSLLLRRLVLLVILWKRHLFI